MGYSPWGHEESDMSEQQTLSLSFCLNTSCEGKVTTSGVADPTVSCEL